MTPEDFAEVLVWGLLCRGASYGPPSCWRSPATSGRSHARTRTRRQTEGQAGSTFPALVRFHPP
jgi:hypothetical protein